MLLLLIYVYQGQRVFVGGHCVLTQYVKFVNVTSDNRRTDRSPLFGQRAVYSAPVAARVPYYLY